MPSSDAAIWENALPLKESGNASVLPSQEMIRREFITEAPVIEFIIFLQRIVLQSMSYHPAPHSLSSGTNQPPLPLRFKNTSTNSLKRSMGPEYGKKATFTSMFCNPSQHHLENKMSLQENSKQDFNGYVLGLVEKDQRQPNPFTQAKLRALVTKDSGESEKTNCSLTLLCREVTAVQEDCEGQSEQVTMKQISQRERMRKSMVISCITTSLT